MDAQRSQHGRRYYDLAPSLAAHLYRLPPPAVGSSLHQAFAGRVSSAMIASYDRVYDRQLSQVQEGLPGTSGVFVFSTLSDSRINELLTPQLRVKYPEIDSYLRRSNKAYTHDIGAPPTSWASTPRTVGDTQIVVYRDPGYPQDSLAVVIGHVERAVRYVRSAGFNVPNFVLALPKYTRSLQIRPTANRSTGAEELRVDVEDAYGFHAMAFPPNTLMLSSRLTAPLDEYPETPYAVDDLLADHWVGSIVHELGHLIHRNQSPDAFTDLWNTALRDPRILRSIGGVSQYALNGETLQEFVAEYFVGLVFERTYADTEAAARLHQLYTDLGGPTPQNPRISLPAPALRGDELDELTAQVNARVQPVEQRSKTSRLLPFRQSSRQAAFTREQIAAVHDQLSLFERILALPRRADAIADRLRTSPATASSSSRHSTDSSHRPKTPFRPGAPGQPPALGETSAEDTAGDMSSRRGARPLPEPPALPDGVLPSDAEYGDEDVPSYAVRPPVKETGETAVSGRGGWQRISRSIPGVTSRPAISRDTWKTHPDPAGREAAQADAARFIAQRYPVLDSLNPTGNELNCNGAVLAVDNMLDGHTTVRVPPASTPDFYGAFRLKDRYQGRWAVVFNYDDVIDAVQQRPGSRGVVYISRPGPNRIGHLFNVVNTDDGVVFLDGQAGTLAELPADAEQIGLLFYHPDDRSPVPAHRSTVPATSIDRPPLPTGPQPPRHNDAHTVLRLRGGVGELDGDIIDGWETQSAPRSRELQQVDERLAAWRDYGRSLSGRVDLQRHQLEQILSAIDRWSRSKQGRSSKRDAAVDRLRQRIETELSDVAAQHDAGVPARHDKSTAGRAQAASTVATDGASRTSGVSSGTPARMPLFRHPSDDPLFVPGSRAPDPLPQVRDLWSAIENDLGRLRNAEAADTAGVVASIEASWAVARSESIRHFLTASSEALQHGITERERFVRSAERYAAAHRRPADSEHRYRAEQLAGHIRGEIESIREELGRRDNAVTQQMIAGPRVLRMVDSLHRSGNADQAVAELTREHAAILAELRSLTAGRPPVDGRARLLHEQADQIARDIVVIRDMFARTGWRALTEAQVTALVLAELRGREVQERERQAATRRLLSEEWPWLAAYGLRPGPELDRLLQDVHDHLTRTWQVTTNLRMGMSLGTGASLIDQLTAGPDARFQNFWETGTSGGQANLALRASREEHLGYAATLNRTTGPFQNPIPDAIRDRFNVPPESRRQLPKYAALMSPNRPLGLPGYGETTIHWKPQIRGRITTTPHDSLSRGVEGAQGATGAEHVFSLLAYGQQDVIRLALAETTGFTHDPALRDQLRRGAIASGDTSSGYFEAQIHGDLSWADVDHVVLNEDDPHAKEHATRLTQFARTHGFDFDVRIHRRTPPASDQPTSQPHEDDEGDTSRSDTQNTPGDLPAEFADWQLWSSAAEQIDWWESSYSTPDENGEKACVSIAVVDLRPGADR